MTTQATQQQQVNPAPGPSGRQNMEGWQDQEAVGPALEAEGPVLEAGGPEVLEANTQRQPHQLGKGGKRTPRHGYRDLAASAVDLLNVRLSDIKF